MRELTLAAGAAALLFAGAAAANVNLDWEQSFGGSGFDDGAASEFNTQIPAAETADDFFLDFAEIKQLRFWMIASRAFTFDYGFNIFRDDGGQPAESAFFNLQGGGTITDLGEILGAGSPFNLYLVEFDVNLTLTAGERWWVSPYGEGTGSGRVFWATDTTQVGNGQEGFIRSAQFGFPDWTPISNQTGDPWEMAFQVWTVPAPGALALLGLAGFVSRRRRRA